MLKLKNISQNDIILENLGMQLIHSNDYIELDNLRKTQASNSSQLITLLCEKTIVVLDHDNSEITDISLAIDVIKGFSIKNIATFDDKLLVQSSSRPIGTFTCFTSVGDKQENIRYVGNGQEMIIDHKIDDPLEQIIYADFNVKQNKTFMQEGYAMCNSANFDKLILDVVPQITHCTSGSNTFFNIYNGFLVVPAAGNGYTNITPENMKLVEIPLSVDDVKTRTMPAFWNADYDINTNSYSNISAAPNGDGQYNMFSSEVVLARIANLSILGEHMINLKTSDVAELTQGFRIRYTFITNPPNHIWKMCVTLTLHRSYTSNF